MIARTSKISDDVSRSKGIDPRYNEAVWDFVRRILREDFWDEKRGEPNQTRAAKAMRIAQPTLSTLYRRERGAGLDILIRIRDYAGVTLDDILGLPPAQGRRHRHDPPLRTLIRPRARGAGE